MYYYRLLFILFVTNYLFSTSAHSQSTFNYTLHLQAKTIDGLIGLHSYAAGQYDGKWILIGGRRDGIHARQPFNAFPAQENNTTIYVVDPLSEEVWTATLSSLGVALQEQLQSTNMQFYQDDEMLYFIGGYGYSATEGDHRTFPQLTAIDLGGLTAAVINEASITPYFEQISDAVFAVTGGYLGKLGDRFLLVGGHQFDGRYNPMGHPTFVQVYTNQIRSFRIIHENGLAFTDYATFTDEINLHRRDYNLVAQVFPDGTLGYTMFSGVFQYNQDLPFLYPVDIRGDSIEPIYDFNQLLSNYHSARVPLFEGSTNTMHTLFFGGISQYYYDADQNLIQDNNVPFVKTISRVSRDANGTLEEVVCSQQMPTYLGSSAEFIPNPALPKIYDDIIQLDALTGDSILLGYVFGGIESPAKNPFSFNNSTVTSASNTLFEVHLIPEISTGFHALDGYHDFALEVFPNPAESGKFRINMQLPEPGNIEIMITDIEGKIGMFQTIDGFTEQDNQIDIQMNEGEKGVRIVTLILNGKYFTSQKIRIE